MRPNRIATFVEVVLAEVVVDAKAAVRERLEDAVDDDFDAAEPPLNISFNHVRVRVGADTHEVRVRSLLEIEQLPPRLRAR